MYVKRLLLAHLKGHICYGCQRQSVVCYTVISLKLSKTGK